MNEIKSVQFFTDHELGESGIGVGNIFLVGDFTPKKIIEKIELKNNVVRIYIKNKKEETMEIHEYNGFQFKLVYV
jgi:hypothetical protein